jgi:hypothetical protein
MSDGAGEIIIKGGSCEIHFDHDIFQRDEFDVKKRSQATMNIKRITISGDTQFADLDTDEHPDKFTRAIKIICR